MRIVPLDRLRPGDRLARDVQPDPAAVPLLREGVRMSERLIDSLRRAGIPAVYVDDDLSAGIAPQPVLSDRTRDQAVDAVTRAVDGARAAASRGTPLDPSAIGALASVVDRVLYDISAAPEATLALNDLAAADAYTLRHSINVTVLGLMIAQRSLAVEGWLDYRGERRYDRVDERLHKVGVGLLLHDIGKLGVPPEIVNKPGRLDPAEWEAMRQHPIIGYEMVRRSQAASYVATAVIRSHHERWDGSGYPDRLEGERIPQPARLAAVADVHDAICSERPYSGAAPTHVGVRVVIEGAGRLFDPSVVAAFRQVVAPYPPGESVALEDGRRGIVVRVPRGAFDRPVVRIVLGADGAPVAHEEIDLLAQPGVAIADAGVELRPAA